MGRVRELTPQNVHAAGVLSLLLRESHALVTFGDLVGGVLMLDENRRGFLRQPHGTHEVACLDIRHALDVFPHLEELVSAATCLNRPLLQGILERLGRTAGVSVCFRPRIDFLNGHTGAFAQDRQLFAHLRKVLSQAASGKRCGNRSKQSLQQKTQSAKLAFDRVKSSAGR